MNTLEEMYLKIPNPQKELNELIERIENNFKELVYSIFENGEKIWEDIERYNLSEPIKNQLIRDWGGRGELIILKGINGGNSTIIREKMRQYEKRFKGKRKWR